MYDGCGPTRSGSRPEGEAVGAIACACVRMLCCAGGKYVLVAVGIRVFVECSLNVQNWKSIHFRGEGSLNDPG
jgi:hypothetical protein